MTLRAHIAATAIWSPGLESWPAARPVLTGATPHLPTAATPPPPAILPPTERRRTGPVIRLALAAAHEATQASGLDPASLRSVFGSSNGDGVVVGTILDALATAAPGERIVSPTQFHNSVHNAAAGYWSIATGGRQPATCLGAHDWTWAAALLKATIELHAEQQPVLLVVYDHPLPPPLDVLRPTIAPFATALVLTPSPQTPTQTPTLTLTLEPGPATPTPLPPTLEPLHNGNAAARALPLLAAIAHNHPTTQHLAYLDSHLVLTFTP